MLKRQYRMVPPIGGLISECFYDGTVESKDRALDPRLTTLAGRAVAWISTRYLADRRDQGPNQPRQPGRGLGDPQAA